MNIELVGKDLPVSEMLKDRIEQKLGKIESRLGQKLFVRVKMQPAPKDRFNCAIHFTGGGHDFNANATGDDLVKAADEAVSKIERQVKKANRRDHRSPEPAEIEPTVV
ncbi:MAG: ribosome-associated translation inhibitor RaiA [Myxococcales bacterium]|nr:ribosome-associated translation inhibitor RaiA [Myxococcales bacterium]